MKKLLLFFIFITLSIRLCAEEFGIHQISDDNGIIKASWSPFQLALAPEPYCQLITGRANIYGLAIGLLVLEQESATISVSLTSGQNKNYGLQCGVVTLTSLNYGLNVGPLASFIDRNYGLQIGFVTVEAEGRNRNEKYKAGTPGMQIGAFNIGQGFQIGLLNYNTNSYIPILPLFNFSK